MKANRKTRDLEGSVKCLLLASLLGLSGGCGGGGPDDPGPTSAGLRLEVVVSGLNSPVHVTSAAGDPRLFVVEQAGRIRVVQGGTLRPEPFLDIHDRVASGGERGLLSVAFHPRFAENGRLFVYYTDLDGDIRIERYTVNSARTSADPASAHPILTVEHSAHSNHNGGLALFGPDGRLYIGTGDGGGGGDPNGNGQNAGTLLAKLLRIDVDAADPYAIPADNPFAGQAGARGEVWALGVRNPWRFTFDGGQLWLADVGQNAWEEVNVTPLTTAAKNFGWNAMEGAHCYQPSSGCQTAGKLLPVLEYGHDQGCSITGGVVYRGAALAALRGHYFYSDYCEGWVRSFRLENGRPVDGRSWEVGDVGNVTSFGTDSAGEMYLTSSNGRLYRFVPDR
jgi:glucose/arabinose dehydrogenase